jgi:hypothetical protein
MSTYLYTPGTGWPRYTPRHWIPFSSSYDSQGYGGGIRTRLHTGQLELESIRVESNRIESYATTDSQSASLSWNEAPSGAYDQILITVRWPYFTVSNSRLPFSSPPTIRTDTVEVFDPPPHHTSPTVPLLSRIDLLPWEHVCFAIVT